MSAQPAPRPDGRRRILLVRHGQAYNSIEPDGRREVVDRSNPPLTPTGEQQAGELARLLADFAPDRVLCSPFLRVAQTLHLALDGTPVPARADVRLSEEFVFDSLADFSGADLADSAARFGDAIEFAPELGERASYPELPEAAALLRERLSDLLTETLADTGWNRVAFFGHGATVGGLARLLLPTADLGEPAHASVTEVVEASDGWEPVRIAQLDHLSVTTR